jgi:hypothetical protein
MTADDDWQSSIQSYIPEINETNWRRQKGQSTCSNLNIRRNIHHGPDGKKMLNITLSLNSEANLSSHSLE